MVSEIRITHGGAPRSGGLSQTGKRLGISALIVFLLVPACATTSSDTTSGGIVTTSTVHVGTTSGPVATTGSTTATTSSPPSTNGTGESVVIRSIASSFGPGETVTFVVSNGLARAITTQDQRGFCSIVFVDRREGGEWEPAAPCVSGPPPVDVVIGAANEMSVDLRLPLEPGTYRGRLVYSVGGTYLVEETLEAVSNEFVVE